MKNFLTITATVALLGILPARLMAQTDSTKSSQEPSLLSPSLDFSTVQKNDNTIDLKATLKTKFKGSFIQLPELKVTFYQTIDAGEKNLGFAITNSRGVAVFNYKADSLTADKDGKVNLKAAFAGNKSMDPADGEATIKRARLEITPVKEDSSLSVQLKLVDLSTGKEKPVPEINLTVYVKRMFYPLKIGEGKTDSSGNVSVDIPNTLPGDAQGNITLLGRLDDNDTYGMLEAATSQKWGVPVSQKIEIQERSLWSTHPPIWMLITFIVLMVAVWGHYIVIVYELFRLRKEEPHEVSEATN